MERSAAKELKDFREELAKKLATSPEALTSAEDEVFLHAVRSQDLDSALRLACALKLARALAHRDHDVARHTQMELVRELPSAKDILLSKPHLSIELAHVCEASKGLCDAAAVIYEALEDDATRHPLNKQNPYGYVLVDLADWRSRCGQLHEARHLMEMARKSHPSMQDPRVFPRHLSWRFNTEPGVPHDCFRVEASHSLADAQLAITRPLARARRACPCSCCAIELSRSTSAPGLEGGQSPGGLQRLLLGPDTSPDASPMSATPQPSSPTSFMLHSELLECAAAPQSPSSVPARSLCRELDRRFNVGSCLRDLGCPLSAAEEDLGLPASRVRAAESAAERLIKARRFKVRIIGLDADEGAVDSEEQGTSLSNIEAGTGDDEQGSEEFTDMETETTSFDD